MLCRGTRAFVVWAAVLAAGSSANQNARIVLLAERGAKLLARRVLPLFAVAVSAARAVKSARKNHDCISQRELRRDDKQLRQ